MQPELLGLGRGEFASPRSIARSDRTDASAVRPDAQRPASGDGEAVKITLSDEAQKRLAADAAADRPNPPAVAPSEQARLEVAASPGLGDMPFGKVVSAIARQLDLSGLFTQASSTPAKSSDEASDGVAKAVPEQGESGDRKQQGSRVSILA